MSNVWAALGSPWINRYNRDSEMRRQARAATSHLIPAVVITGGSRGIGLALAHAFVTEGHTVVLVARDAGTLADAAKTFAASDAARAVALHCDVTAPDAPETIAAELARHGCYADILVNNAGVGVSGPFSCNDTAALDALVALNVAAVTRLTRWALPGMIARGQGGILNVASLGGVVPGPHQAAYYASKAYVMSLTEAISMETGGHGVRISVVAPGPVETSFHAAMGADRALYRTVLPGLTPDQIARSSYRWFMLGQRVIVPNVFYRLIYATLRVTPHPVSGWLTGRLLKNPARRS